MHKPIILIGGTAGTGKTTLAHNLCSLLNIDHRLGTGFIREIVRSQTTPEKDECLFEYTFRADDPVAHLVHQSERLYNSINACIDRAKREGTSLVIEGNHLIPRLYYNHAVDLYVVLSTPNLDIHQRQLQGLTHAARELTSSDIDNVRKIGTYLEQECERFSVQQISYPYNLNEIVERIK